MKKKYLYVDFIFLYYFELNCMSDISLSFATVDDLKTLHLISINNLIYNYNCDINLNIYI